MKNNFVDILFTVTGVLTLALPAYVIAYLYKDGVQWYDHPSTFNIIAFYILFIKFALTAKTDAK